MSAAVSPKVDLSKDPLEEMRAMLHAYRTESPAFAHHTVQGLMRMGRAERTELMCWILAALMHCENARMQGLDMHQQMLKAIAEAQGATRQ